MTAHKHAALMLQYAQDAAETQRPWDRWENSNPTMNPRTWSACIDHPEWNPAIEYRRGPKRTIVNGALIVAPRDTAPALKAAYYVVSLYAENWCTPMRWSGTAFDERALLRGLVFDTEDDARAYALALMDRTA